MGQEIVLIALAVSLYFASTASASEQKILELHLVCDKSCYEKMTTWEDDPYQYTADLIKEVNLRFAEINLLVVLVDFEIWNGVDMQETEAGADDLYSLRSIFGGYRHLIRLNHIWSDASILLTGTDLPTSIGSDANGVFMTGAICMRSNAAGVVKYQRQPASNLAATVVHELGHALGMEHDNSGCCSAGNGNCIMAAFINQYQISNPQFSSCSKTHYENFLKKTRSSCLTDNPPKVFPLPGVDTCGNGVVEDGEDCDCPQGCACCDSSCKLKMDAQCWHGGCCDDTCKIVHQGVVCNPTSSSCDLDDVCTGTSAECPNIFGDNGVACTGSGDESGYCYRGQCLTRDSQCSSSWNPGFKGGKDSCYRTSLTISSGMSHCGPTPGRPGFYDKCTETSLKNYKCGLLQCEFSGYPGYTERDVDQARSAQYNFFVPDRCMIGESYEWEADRGGPLMITDGTKCGENLICFDTNCLSKESVYSDLASRSTSREVAEYCGDGVVSGDEECDCGALQCDCCKDCQLISQGVKCRFTECKVCDGSTRQCPSESFMNNFKNCKDEGHCFNGNCVSLANSCKKYFGESASAARELYQDGLGQNSSEHNVGGFRMYDEESGQLVEEEYKLVIDNLDRECGVLLCESYNSALVVDEDGNAEASKTFQSDKGWGFRYAYYNLETTHHGPNQTYGSYYPLLADQGSPCTTADGQPGFCNKHYLTMSNSKHAWYGYTKCTPVAEGTAT